MKNENSVNRKIILFRKWRKCSKNATIRGALFLLSSFLILGNVPLTAQNYIQFGLDIDGEAAGDESGQSVSLSSDGTIVAIGARRNDGNGTSSGHTRVYEWNGTNWIQLGADIDGEGTEDLSGQSVSLSSDGTIVAIGAIANDGNGTSSGHTRVYEWNGTNWIQLGTDIDGEGAGDLSGQSVSLSSDGTIVAIGAIFNDGNGTNSGHTRVYEWNGTNWIQFGADIDGEAFSDQSGWSVSLSSDGTIVAIGAIGNDGNGTSSGHTRVYEWNGTNWIQLGADIDGEGVNNQSGYSVSLSSDGTIVTIGARLNDGNGSNSGHTRVYEWNGTNWNQLGTDIDGEAAGDESSYSVSLSSDGTIVAIGAIRNDGNGTNSGHTRVYKITLPTIANNDADGDNTPDIADPCDCTDPMNPDPLVVMGPGGGEVFHELVTVTSGPGETWEMDATTVGALDATGAAAALPLAMTEVSPGVYTLSFYHEINVGYTGDFSNGTSNLSIANSCTISCLSDVPTLNEWGLIILTLLLLNLSILMMRRKEGMQEKYVAA